MIESVISIDNPILVKGLTIIPVVKLSLHYSFTAGITIFSTKQPIAVIIIFPSHKKIFRITGEEIPLEQLIQEVPEIVKVLEKVQPAL